MKKNVVYLAVVLVFLLIFTGCSNDEARETQGQMLRLKEIENDEPFTNILDAGFVLKDYRRVSDLNELELNPYEYNDYYKVLDENNNVSEGYYVVELEFDVSYMGDDDYGSINLSVHGITSLPSEKKDSYMLRVDSRNNQLEGNEIVFCGRVRPIFVRVILPDGSIKHRKMLKYKDCNHKL